MDDWYENSEGIENKKCDENYLQHSQTLNFLNYNNSTLNNNNGINEQAMWDFSSQATYIDQSNINIFLYIFLLNINYLNFIIKYRQYSYCIIQLIFLIVFKLKIKDKK